MIAHATWFKHQYLQTICKRKPFIRSSLSFILCIKYYRLFGNFHLRRHKKLMQETLDLISRTYTLSEATSFLSAEPSGGCLPKDFTLHQHGRRQTHSIIFTNAPVWQGQGKEPTSCLMCFLAFCLLIGSGWLMGLLCQTNIHVTIKHACVWVCVCMYGCESVSIDLWLLLLSI